MTDFDYGAWVARAQAFTDGLQSLPGAEVHACAAGGSPTFDRSEQRQPVAAPCEGADCAVLRNPAFSVTVEGTRRTPTLEGTPMAGRSLIRSAARAVSVVVAGTLWLAGCAVIQPPPVPRVPNLGQGDGTGDAACITAISRAHAAIAAAGAAGGDPAATADAHAASAAAMHEYHTCLARGGRP